VRFAAGMADGHAPLDSVQLGGPTDLPPRVPSWAQSETVSKPTASPRTPLVSPAVDR